MRDLHGYGANPPDLTWPDGSRVAVNVVLNIEEGSEPSFDDGDGYTENRLTEAGRPRDGHRDLAAEAMFEYGSRVGFWRIRDIVARSGLPLTAFACALALERNPAMATAVAGSDWDICSHGWRWEDHMVLSEGDERDRIHRAVESLRRTTGKEIHGWYCRYGPSVNTRRLVAEHGGFLYDSDSYADDLPYWTEVDGGPHLVVPYSLVTNDGKFFAGLESPDAWLAYILGALDQLRMEAESRPSVLSIGLHQRIIGQPARAGALARLLDHLGGLDDVWVARRVDIARHFAAEVPPAR